MGCHCPIFNVNLTTPLLHLGTRWKLHPIEIREFGVWMSNYIPWKIWDVSTYPIPNSNYNIQVKVLAVAGGSLYHEGILNNLFVSHLQQRSKPDTRQCYNHMTWWLGHIEIFANVNGYHYLLFDSICMLSWAQYFHKLFSLHGPR